MNETFGRVAAHCGLRLSYYTISALVGLSFLILAFTDYRTPSPLYILLMLSVLPSVMKSLFFTDKKIKKRENELAFPLFQKKYHYDYINYKSMSIAYLLLFVLLAAWQISYINSNVPALIRNLPAFLAAASLLIRILGIAGYRLYFYLFPLKAMH